MKARSGILGKRVTWMAAAALFVALLTAALYAIVVDIETEYSISVPAAPLDTTAFSKPLVRIAVISRYPPTVTYRGYQPILDYLTSRTPYRFELLLGADYTEALENLLAGRAAAVFLGSYLYVKARERYDILPILKPLNENRQPLARSVLFVRSGSPIQTVQDLVGKRLALPSSESYSANWPADQLFPRHRIAVADIGRMQNFSHHHTVIAQVLNGMYDAGVTREYLVKDLLGGSFRAIAYSDPIPSSPIVVRASHDRILVQAIREALLDVNRDEATRAAVTREWDPEFVNGFVPASDADYDTIRRRR